MARTKWRSYWFSFEVAVESPVEVDDDEAAEDAAEFASSVGHKKGLAHKSKCTVVRVNEHGFLQPTTRAQQEVIKREAKIINHKPAQVVKAKKKVKSKAKRF